MPTSMNLQHQHEPDFSHPDFSHSEFNHSLIADWLSEHIALYHEQPSRAEFLLQAALSVFEKIKPQNGNRCGVELALFICDMALEIRKISSVATVIETARQWCVSGIASDLQIEILCMQAHCAIWNEQFELAGTVLQRVMELNKLHQDKLKLAYSFSAFGLLAHRQKDLSNAVCCLNQAISLFQSCNYHGPWIQNYTILAIVQRELGQQSQRQAALTDGIALGTIQKRWYETSNLITGLIDIALEQGDLATAEREFLHCEKLAGLASQNKFSNAHIMLEFSRARILAAKGDYSTACAALRDSFKIGAKQFSATEMARRYELLADWLAADGQAEQALIASRQAQTILIEQIKAAARHDLIVLQQHMALEHAQAERRHSAQHARELETKNQKLEQALQLQKDLQAELIENSKLASLGSLFAGMSHELNTPIGNSLMAASIIAEINHSVLNKIGAPPLAETELPGHLHALHNELRGELHICQQSAEMLERNLQLAATLVASYKDMNTRNNELNCGTQELRQIIENAWERALTPGNCLNLTLHCDDMIAAPVDALNAILIQLFENIQRHAYDDGCHGQVQVIVQTFTDEAEQEWVSLKVSDQGRGITADLLPRIFEPYVSTQFGRGRSGLGLFVVQVAVKQRLAGRIHALSQSGAGTSIEIVWPQSFRLQLNRPPLQAISLDSAVSDYLSNLKQDTSEM